MKLSIKNLLDRIPGTTAAEVVTFPVRFVRHLLGETIELTTDVEAEFEGMRVPEGILGRFQHITARYTRPCDGCGKILPCAFADVSTGWRSFELKPDEMYKDEELQDVFPIDRTEGSVILDECLRQELLLSLSPYLLCPACESLGTASVLEEGDKPFKDLKNLLG